MVVAPQEGLLLLKVPQWLSEEWLKAGPEDVVAQLDLEAGKLLLQGGHHDRPSTFRIQRRPATDLCAFTAEGEDKGIVKGLIQDTLHVQADIQDEGYKNMLQLRVEQNSVTAGSRSVSLRDIPAEMLSLNDLGQWVKQQEQAAKEQRNLPTKPVVQAAAPNVPLAWKLEPPSVAAVSAALKKCLQDNADSGASFEELLAALPRASALVDVRTALASLAELREVDGKRRFFYKPLRGHLLGRSTTETANLQGDNDMSAGTLGASGSSSGTRQATNMRLKRMRPADQPRLVGVNRAQAAAEEAPSEAAGSAAVPPRMAAQHGGSLLKRQRPSI